MTKEYEGTNVFLWQASQVCGGNVDAMIAQLKEIGATGVLIKFANGNLVGDPVSQAFLADFKRLAPAFKSAGFTVGGWIYQYLTDVAGEVDACAQAIAAGAEWIVLDGEADVVGKHAQVQQFGQLLRNQFPNLIVGFSSYAIAENFPTFPWKEYAAFADVLMPQIYWGQMRWDVTVAYNTSMTSWMKFANGKPVLPTGQAYDAPAEPAYNLPPRPVTSDEMAKFVALCKNACLPGISWWDWQHMTADHRAGVKANVIHPTAPPAAPPAPPSDPAHAQIAKDVPNDHWVAKSGALPYVLQEGIMTLDQNGNFNPDAPATRAMIAQIVFNERHQAK